MKHHPWIRRCAVVAALTIATFLALFAIRAYARSQVIAAITKLHQAPIRVGAIRWGTRVHRIYDLQLLQPGSNEVYGHIGAIEFELPIFDAIQGERTPGRVLVKNPVLVLQLDEKGALTTPLPALGQPPHAAATGRAVEVVNGRIDIQQPGRDLFVADQISLQVTSDRTVSLTGEVGDLLGAKWPFAATADLEVGNIEGKITTSEVHVDAKILDRLPFVPKQLADDWQFSLAAAVDLSGSYRLKSGLSYHMVVTLEELNGSLRDLDLRQGQGTVVVDNGNLQLSQVKVKTLGGSVRLDGGLDFNALRASAWTVHVEDLEIGQLSKLWDLPQGIQGHITADGEFLPQFHELRWRVGGRARGTIFVADPTMPLQMVPFSLNLLPKDDSTLQEKITDGNYEVDLELGISDLPIAKLAPWLPEGTPRVVTESGHVSFQGHIVATLSDQWRSRRFEAAGDLQVARLEVGGEPLELQARLSWQDGILRMMPLTGVLGSAGTFSGNASSDLRVDAPTLDATVDFEALPLQVLTVAISDAPKLTGRIRGNGRVNLPLKQFSDPRQWTIQAALRSEQIQLREWSFSQLRSRVEFKDGILQLRDVTAELARQPWRASLMVSLHDNLPFRLQVVTNQVSVDSGDLRWPETRRPNSRIPGPLAAQQAIDPFAAVVDIQGTVRGTLKPFEWKAQGTATAPNVEIRHLKFRDVHATWFANEAAFQVRRVRADGFGGEVALTATVSLQDQLRATGRGQFRQVNAAELAPLLSAHVDLPPETDGILSGSFSVRYEEARGDLVATLDFSGLRAAWPLATIEAIGGTLSYQSSTLDARLEGLAFGSPLAMAATLSFPLEGDEAPSLVAHVSCEELDLARLKAALPNAVPPLDGVASAQLQLGMRGRESPLTGGGRLELRNVRLDGIAMTPLISCDTVFVGHGLECKNISTEFAGGRLSGGVRVDLLNPEQSTFVVNADRVDIDKLPPAWRPSPASARGRVDLRLSGRFGSQIQSSGSIQLSNGSLAAVPIKNARANVSTSYAPRAKTVKSKLRLSSARVAGGRVLGEVELDWARQLGLRGTMQLVNADVRTLTKGLSDLRRPLLSGRLRSNVSFRGTNVQGLDDLRGSFQAELSRSQPLMLPIVEELSTILRLGMTDTYQTTKARGSFRDGTLTLDQLTMESPTSHVLVEGTIDKRGYLDFDLTADTPEAAALGVLTGIFRPTDLLRRRLIFLHISGSPKNPMIQPRIPEFINQEIELFFLPLLLPL